MKAFICISHKLTQSQITALEEMGVNEIILLSDVNPELAATCKAIGPNWNLDKVKSVAEGVVKEATKLGCDYFVCQGEPALALHANLIASMHVDKVLNKVGRGLGMECPNHSVFFNDTSKAMVCLQSTTARKSVEEEINGKVVKKSIFEHVQWRNMF